MAERSSEGWRRVRTADGTLTLVHPGHGEACHSHSGARLESRERYVLGCEAPARWRERPDHPWRLLDIGTGLGWNLAATLEAWWLLAPESRPALELVTLEASRDVLEAAFELPSQGRALERIHAALGAALERAPGTVVQVEPGVKLALWLGDASATVRALARPGSAVGGLGFDALYLDPFSPRLEPELWSLDFFRDLLKVASPRARLATYCAATHVRAALAAAGWRVGPAPRVGAKAEGTLACRIGEIPAFSDKVSRRIARRAQEFDQDRPSADSTE